MASSPLKSVSEPAIIEQVINEFFAKGLHIILESRSPYVSSRNYCTDLFVPSPSSSPSSSSGQPRDRWFNLALRDCPAALENFDLWRQSNLEPLVIDVILSQRGSKERPLESWSSGNEFLPDSKREKIVERWVVQYESRKSNNVPRELHLGSRRSGSGGCSHASEIPAAYKKTYKRTTIMLRSLYVTVRLLPAYKVFRDLNSSGRICAFSLSHKISSFVAPFTRSEDAEMNQFTFVPVDTPCGRLSLSVSYLPTLEDLSLEPSASMSMSPQFIPDYVGSPLTDPLKRLHSLPSAGSLPTYISFTRRHSWSNDHGVEPSVSSSPSPAYSDSRATHCAPSPQLPPRSPLPDQFPFTCPTSHNLWSLAHKKNTSFDEYWPSPPFSPSSTPSPPAHCPGVHMRNSLLRSESAPVNIPLPSFGTSGGMASHGLPPSPSPKHAKPVCSSQADLLRAKVTGASASQTLSPESMLQLKKGSDDLHTGMTLQKILYSGKDEFGSLSGRRLSSCSSPRIPSRSSSRFSLLDEFDDSQFAYPFAVDDEPTDSSRTESADADGHAGENSVSGELIPVRRSPDAVVGALVRMLKTAAPLRQDLPNSVISSQVVKEEMLNQGIQHNKDVEVGAEKISTASGSMITASGLYKSRTAADALEELNSYKEMREFLLKQGASQSLQVDKAESVDHEDNASQAENSASEASL